MGEAVRWGGVLLLLALVGCAGRVWRDHADADGIALHWYTREATINIARAAAAEHCSDFGKRAELVSEFEDHDITRASFACRGG
jgi:hypothetical protein